MNIVMANKIPVRIQMTPGENGATALFMMLGYFGKYVNMKEVREACVTSRNGSSPQQLIDGAAKFGLEGEVREVKAEELKSLGLPLLVHWKKRYYVIVRKMNRNTVWLVDPAKGDYKLTVDKFNEYYSGKVLYLKKGPDFVADGKQESLFSLISGRLKKLVGPMIGLLVLSLICIGLDMLVSYGNKFFMDSIVSWTGEVPEFMLRIAERSRLEVKDAATLITLIGMYALMIASTAFTIGKDRLVNNSSRKMSAESGSDLFKHMFAQPMKFFEQHSAGALISRFDANAKLDNSLIQAVVPRTINAVMMVFYFIMLMQYNSTIALICLGLDLVNSFVQIKLQERSALVARVTATTSSELNASLLNGMNMIDTIKSTGSEKAFFDSWYDSQATCNDSKLSTFRINRMMSICSNIHSYINSAVLLFLGAYFIAEGMLTLGTMALFNSVLGKMRDSMNSVLSSFNTLQTMRTNIERVNDIMERPIPDPIPLQPDVEYDKLSGRIKASHLNYRYNSGDRLAIDDVSMEVEPGQMVAIVGATGCGKSTLLKILADLYTADSGEILYGGLKRSEIPDVVFHSSIATVDQETAVFEDSIFNNITMWDQTVEDYEVYLAARDSQIHERIMRDKEGYSAVIKENGQNFSGGELQRLELARALSHEPTMLFLDEFTSALDALTEDKVIQAIRNKGTTCVIVAHRLSTIVDCDRIYVMDQGKIVQEGTHNELYNQEGLYRELIGLQ